MRLLDDVKNDRLPLPDLSQYKETIRTWLGIEKYADYMLKHIDPDVLALQGQPLTPVALEKIRLQQSEQWPLNVGYLDYVTDSRCENYLRFYVGQTIKSTRRIMIDHCQSILKCRNSSLHYFIVWLGNGYRRANFLRLWALPYSMGRSNDKQVLSDMLETLFIRVFRSDHGGCSPSGSDAEFEHSSGLGLNILCPFAQNSNLTNDIMRLPYVTPVRRSADPQISMWDEFRRVMKSRLKLEETATHIREPPWAEPQYFTALQQAIGDKNCLGDLELSFQHVPETNDHLPAQWFDDRYEHVATNSPLGSLTAPISFILDYASAIESDLRETSPIPKTDTGFPWVLQRTGFDVNNALVWTFDFTRYDVLNPFDLRNPRSSSLVQELNRAIIQQSSSKVVILCGARPYVAATAGLVHDRRQAWRYLQLRCGYRVEYIVSQEDGHVPKRLYIRCPEMPADIHSIPANKALMISEIFKCAAAIVGLKNVRPYFMETSCVLFGIVRARKQENDGHKVFGRSDLDTSFLTWLFRKGFTEDDVDNLERAGGGIIQGLVILLRCLARSAERRPHRKSADNRDAKKEIQWEGWKKLDPYQISQVQGVYDTVIARLEDKFGRHPRQKKRRTSSNESLHSSASACSSAELRVVEEENDDAKLEDIDWGTRKASALLEGDTIASDEMTGDTAQRQNNGISTSGQSVKRLTTIKNWSQEVGTDLTYSYHITSGTVWNIKLCFVQIPVPASAGIVAGSLSIKIEIADEGQSHRNFFAKDSLVEDIARRIAFRLRGKNTSGEVVEYYPSRTGYATVAKMNTLGDKIIYGDEAVAISKRSRRYLYLDPPGRSWGPNLQHFVGGGYTNES